MNADSSESGNPKSEKVRAISIFPHFEVLLEVMSPSGRIFNKISILAFDATIWLSALRWKVTTGTMKSPIIIADTLDRFIKNFIVDESGFHG